MISAAAQADIANQLVALLALVPPHGDLRLRVRVWVRGDLAAERWWTPLAAGGLTAIEDDSTDTIGAVKAASAAGFPWLIEYHCPGAPEDRSCVRFGTDAAMMPNGVVAGSGV